MQDDWKSVRADRERSLCATLLVWLFCAAGAAQDRLPLVLQWASPVPYGIAISAGAILLVWLQNSAILTTVPF